jgi:uncharacterized protein YbjT (DUF2867 family)
MSKLIAVFGSTGAQGGSVLRALANSDKYHVRAITRNSTTDRAKKLAKLKNVSVHEADLSDRASLDKTLKGCYGTFLVTDFSVDPKASSETQQGINLIDSSIKNKLSHVVLSGLENVSSVINKPCVHFDNKEKIEQYGIAAGSKINFTSIRMPMYYQVVTSMMLKKVKPDTYILTLPMSDKPVYCMSVDDLGSCVRTIFGKPDEFKSKILNVAGDYLKATDLVDTLNKHLQPNKFAYANLSLEKFLRFGFPGVEDLTNMFEYYQTGKMTRDLKLAKKLNPSLVSFNEWVVKNKQDILKNLPQA